MKTLLVLAATLLCTPVVAQEALLPSPSQGIQLPYGSVAAQDDATALEINPAGLAFMETGELGFGYDAAADDFRQVSNESNAFFMAAGNGIVGTGFSFQGLSQPSGGALLDTYRKYTWGAAIAIPQRLSLGFNVNWFGSSDSQRLDELVSYDLGVQLRLGEHVALGAMLRDVNEPFLSASAATRMRTMFGVHIRLFSGRLQLDSTSTTVPEVDAMEWTPRLMLEPLSGLRIFASARAVLDNRPGQDDFDLREIWGGLELSFSSFGVAYAPTIARGANDDFKLAGLRAYHWFSPSKQRGLFAGSSRWISVNL
ncbi:MAG: hypothetical protein R3E66_24940, partial [bacterium]